MLQPANQFCRNSTHQGPWFDISSDDTSGSYAGVGADSDTREHDCPSREPYIFFQDDWRRGWWSESKFGFDMVKGIVDEHAMWPE